MHDSAPPDKPRLDKSPLAKQVRKAVRILGRQAVIDLLELATLQVEGFSGRAKAEIIQGLSICDQSEIEGG
jgi:hypothetical protein